MRLSSDLSTFVQATYWGGAAAGEDTFRGAIRYRNPGGDIVGCGSFGSDLNTVGAYQAHAAGANEGGFGLFASTLTSNTAFSALGSASASPSETILGCEPVGTDSVVMITGSPDDAYVNGQRTAGATAGNGATSNSAYVIKIDSLSGTMTRDWAVVLGSGTTPAGVYIQPEAGMAINSAGDVYVTGEVGGAGFETLGTFGGGSNDCFVAKISGDGSGQQWLRVIGGSGSDSCTGLALTAADGVVVAGQTDSTDLLTTDDALQLDSGGGEDGFLLVLEPDGTIAYLSYYGGTGDDHWRWPCLRPGSSDYVLVGQSSSASVPGLAGAYQATNGGGLSDILVTRFDDVPNTAIPEFELEGFERNGCQGLITNLAPDCDYTTTVLLGSESLQISNAANNENVASNQSPLTGIGTDIWADFLVRSNSTTSSFVGLGFSTVNGSTNPDTLVQFGIEADQSFIGCRGGAIGTQSANVALPTGTTYHVTIHINQTTGAAEGWLRLDANADGQPDTARGAADYTVDCSAGAPYASPVTWNTAAFSFPGTYDVIFDQLRIYDDSSLAP